MGFSGGNTTQCQQWERGGHGGVNEGAGCVDCSSSLKLFPTAGSGSILLLAENG